MSKGYRLACIAAVIICITTQSSNCSLTGTSVGWKNCTSNAVSSLINKKLPSSQLNVSGDVCQLTAYDKDNNTIMITTVAHFYNNMTIDTNLITPGVRYEAPWFIGSCKATQCAKEIDIFSKAVKGLVCCNRVNSDHSCGSSNTVQLLTGQQRGIVTVVNNYFITTGVITGYLGSGNNVTGSGLLLQQNSSNPGTLIKTGYSAAYNVGGCGALTDNIADITTAVPTAQETNSVTGGLTASNTVIITSSGNILVDVINIGLNNAVTNIAQLIPGLTGSQTAIGVYNAISTATNSVCSTGTCLPGAVASAGFSWVKPADCNSAADANEPGCIAFRAPSLVTNDPSFFIPVARTMGNGGYVPPGGPYPGGVVPASVIPNNIIGSNNIIDSSNIGLASYLPTAAINFGDENQPSALGLVSDCATPNAIPGVADLGIVKEADVIGAVARLQIHAPSGSHLCTASLLNTSNVSLNTTTISPSTPTRFFATAAHCWFGASSYLVGGGYTVGKATLCFGTGLNDTLYPEGCPADQVWNVVQIKATKNAAVFVPQQPLSTIINNIDEELIDNEVDYSVFAATPASSTLSGLCTPGRNFRALAEDDVGKIVTPTGNECVCVQQDHNAFDCIQGCPCLLYDCRTSCTQIYNSGWYVQGYPAANALNATTHPTYTTADGGCVPKNTLGRVGVTAEALYASTFITNVASLSECNQVFLKDSNQNPNPKPLIVPGYSCPGMSGSGLSHPGTTDMVATLHGSSTYCPPPGTPANPNDPNPITVIFTPIRCLNGSSPAGRRLHATSIPTVNPYGDGGCYNTINSATDALCFTGSQGCATNNCNIATAGK